jgi:ATP-dependent RNA helicase DeaD
VTALTFAELPLDPRLLAACDKLGFQEPTPIQARAVPLLLAGRDVVGRARTGSGKTAAFGLPMLHALRDRSRAALQSPAGLVLVPTRELALQVGEALTQLAGALDLRVAVIHGGTAYGPQHRALANRPAIVVGTPGRVLDHLARGTLDLSRVEQVVLDEADEMLRMGFVDDVQTILGHTPKERVTALFSATMPTPIRAVAETHLRDPVEVEVEGRRGSTDHIEQRFLRVHPAGKLDLILRILKCSGPGATLVFTRTRVACAEVADALARSGITVEALHGDLDQQTRERVVGRLRSGVTEVVVATDVAARGLDVPVLSRVVNYDMPDDVDTYVHRIGRTGRAGQPGLAYSFVTRADGRKVISIERTFGRRFEPFAPPTDAQIADVQRKALEGELLEARQAPSFEEALAFVRNLLARSEGSAEELAAAALVRLSSRTGVEIPIHLPALPKPEVEKVEKVEKVELALVPALEPEPEPVIALEPQDPAESDPAVSDPTVNRTYAPPSVPETPEEVSVFLPVGRRHGVRKTDLAGAFSMLGVQGLGRVTIGEAKSFVGLPGETVEALLAREATVTVAGEELRVVRARVPSKKSRTVAHG